MGTPIFGLRYKRRGHNWTAGRVAGVKDNGIAARLGDQKKVLRGRLRTTYWPSLVKSAPKSYGPKGTIKKEPNDRRPWGAIPADVARTIIKNAKR
jgi:hypothetical protein